MSLGSKPRNVLDATDDIEIGVNLSQRGKINEPVDRDRFD